jgi:hypothetical protein
MVSKIKFVDIKTRMVLMILLLQVYMEEILVEIQQCGVFQMLLQLNFVLLNVQNREIIVNGIHSMLKILIKHARFTQVLVLEEELELQQPQLIHSRRCKCVIGLHHS